MRTMSLPLYAATFLVTAVIFAIGFYVGSLWDQGQQEGISKDVDRVEGQLQSLQLLFLVDNSSAFCPVYFEELGKLDKKTEEIGYKLAYLEEEKGIFDTELKKEYFVLETENYLLSDIVRTRCGTKTTLVLYFYSNENCPSCIQFGKDLLEARLESKKSTRVYSFDGSVDSVLVTSLKNKYNVTRYPTIIVDGVSMTLAELRARNLE